ncbi:MAG TPA: hypothetical protein GX012_00710 [Acholeplasma sp.]|nr:hypothetical protein [Acholeplasma sp.]
MKKNKKILILSSLIVVMVVALTFVVSRIGAWLTDEQTTDDVTLQVGQVKYRVENATFVNPLEGPFVPGQNLVEGNTLQLVNESTVSSELRFKYTITYTLSDTTTGDALAEELISSVVFASGWTEGTGELIGYYYLSPAVAALDEAPIGIIDTLVLDGSKVGNSFANATFTINFIFQAKQEEYLTWEDAGSLDFTTGLA